MLSSLKVQDAKREEGFTLIELLVVVIIIGILAAIAIPTFLSQRERAWAAAVSSDLRNAAVVMETVYTDTGNYTTTLEEIEAQGFVSTAGVNDITGFPTADNAQSFCLTAVHENSADTENTYNSAGGLGVAC